MTEAPARDYHIDIIYGDEDECHVTDLPDLGYCPAFGDSPEEALAELLIAKELRLEAAREDGIPLPVPPCRPARLQPTAL
ncbi:MAG: type II toxin-antitoxin system HicB family antitoxin [Dehalococcoidia bacterium]